ncbi:Ppx/GppA phosphatase family protein [Pedobacter insulae]|uniref:Exopolyphosphatase / guanosine-5'-triphosphate,3'-diphosphate pyrophosphatase n=1 Tax=Pedobacter insulae TaxID=414048 RepID=A0A1I2VRI3_9SPHI|nr:exopolyphosphatase [Pedobacter insulae]SFG90076.1 exopolyphosphatase / guanosine-5'-triphosphate,3'-diphosphate pyrophosphatase [Pedobacter insulae]
MKIAIIDLGTNTFHLLIAAVRFGEPFIIYKTNVPVRLGEDITKENSIIPLAFNRGISCLQEFRKTIDFYKIKTIKAVATSGVRSARNGNDFVTAAKEVAGIAIDIIDGDEEATYIYEGVKWSGAITQSSLIMDIGGGSTEFILCDQENVIWKKSYNIGAARLMQSFFKSDPISLKDQLAIIAHLDAQLTELITLCQIHKPKTLIGSAGAFETFDTMINPKLENYTATIDYNAYQELSSKLINANHLQRANMDGLIPLRVDMIVMAALLTNYVLTKLNIKEITLSTFDLKMGVLAKSVEH